MSLPRAGLALSPLLLDGHDTTGWRFWYAAPGAQAVPVLSPARGTGRGPGDAPLPTHLCRPPAARGLCAAVVHRPRPQGLAGVEVHGIRLLPLDVLESHRSLQRGPGMSPRAVPAEGELVVLEEVPASSLVCRGGNCWGKARGTGNPTGFTKDWISQQHVWTVHRAQMERGGDTVWGAGTPPSQDCPPKTERGAHLIGCQQWLAEGFSPVNREPGTGYLHPPGREMSQWG